jgi:hypothetical protein
MLDPSGKAIRIENVPMGSSGTFTEQIFVWPSPSKSFVYGTYTLEINSSFGNPDKQEVTVLFAEGLDSISSTVSIPISHILSVKLDSPAEVAINSSFRIFVQVTYDGALVNSDPSILLGSSHIHSGVQTINIGSKFAKLHEGIYYADVILNDEGNYIFHSTAFYKGFLAHDSKVITASATSINSVQDSVNQLNNQLSQTNRQLANLKSTLVKTDASLNNTRSTITDSLVEARRSIKDDIATANSAVKNLEQSSGQMSSLFLPVLALISVIIALQISLFARIRASYK